MWILSKRILRGFWSQPNQADAEALLRAWYKLVEAANWTCFADLRALFASADQVGNCVVFDIGNNRYRLIARINYRSHRVFVLRVMTHGEYDEQKWIETCGCRKPPPRPKARRPRRR